MEGAILILSGPSGAGKSTIIHEAADRIGSHYFSISSTTRAPRPKEREGVAYHFVSQAAFEAGIAAGEFLEYAQVHGHYYGTSLVPVRHALSEGKLVLFDIDVQGHRLARQAMGDRITSVFITPPSLAELERRLRARSTDTDEVIQRRLHNAREEMQALGEFDYVLINDRVDTSVEAFVSLAKTVRLKRSREETDRLIEQWLGEA